MVVFKAFAALDQDHDGTVCLSEFLKRYHEFSDHKHPHDEFLHRFFGVMGKGPNRASIDPVAFFVCLHNFLVDDEDDMLAFCFRMFDKDHDSHLNIFEFQSLCRLAHPDITEDEVNDKMLKLNYKHTTCDMDRVLEDDGLDMDEVL